MAVAVPMYRPQQNSYLQNNQQYGSSTRQQAYASQQVTQLPTQEEEDFGDEQAAPMFCRALYDYEAQDASALSFRKNDIIEVLSQQPSGWWDGLLGDERGWFPSNYVVIMTEEEIDQAFSGSDADTQMSAQNGAASQPSSLQQPRHSIIDMSAAMMGGRNDNEEWLETELARSGGAVEGLGPQNWDNTNGGSSSSDFWMPQVAPNGQIFYVNTQTGQQSRDLPVDVEDDPDRNIASQSSSRSGTSAGVGIGTNGFGSDHESPGFGVARSTSTPEPWVKKLADDGMSYYYMNKNDGTVQWTRPNGSTTSGPSAAPAPVAAKQIAPKQSTTSLSTSRLNGGSKDNHRLSVYSDSSDIQPADTTPVRMINGTASSGQQVARRPASVVMQLTSAEKIAQSLQQALIPPPPDSLTELSVAARSSIRAVIDHIQHGQRMDEYDVQLDSLIHSVVFAVRNLLYVAAVPTGTINPSVIPKHARTTSVSAAPSTLKPAQRKVTATLSRLVLSARAMQYDSGSSQADTRSRIEMDADELERAVMSFVLDVQRAQHNALPDSPEARPLKRLRGVFMTANMGLGLVGAGTAGGWKGFGFVSFEDEAEAPRSVLGADVIEKLGMHVVKLESNFATLASFVRFPEPAPVSKVRVQSKGLVSQISNFLSFVASIHIQRHVDIDGIRHETNPGPNEQYAATVEQARKLVRMLEMAVQSLYDDTASLLVTTQAMKESEYINSSQEMDTAYVYVDVLTTSLKANLAVVQQTLEALLSVGHDQADTAQGDYNGSIEWRMSRLSVIDTNFGGAIRPLSSYSGIDGVQGDMVDFEMAFGRPALPRALPPMAVNGRTETRYDDLQNPRQAPLPPTATLYKPDTGSSTIDLESSENTVIAESEPYDVDKDFEDVDGAFDDELGDPAPVIRRTNKASKLANIFGDDVHKAFLETFDNGQPWYLRPTYNQTEILIEPDGSVRGGTVPALVERLTAHEHSDPNFIKSFLMTFKSFTTLDELFDLLVQRFWIQPPPKLTPAEREKWGKLKQHIIQARVINVLKSMVSEPDVLEKEDLYILERMKEFLSGEDVSKMGAAKQLLVVIDRLQSGGDPVKVIITSGAPAPPPIQPKSRLQKLKMSDVEPLEMARQLTLFESQLFQKIRATECLQRAREQKTENVDNITNVIQTSNRIAMWVADLVLSKEDARRRGTTVKHLISIADRCRTLNNFSTMIAITSGLNTPPIRRLKRTWEQVGQRYMSQFAACEMTIDSNKNFNKYRSLMATVNPPCVPFIGVFLSTLQFIQDGNPDNLPGGLVNFRKRQKATEVINDIKRWQAQSFNFISLPNVQSYIEESLAQYHDSKASSDLFWQLSLEREPREREDEKMARLLQESGFL